ncbi:MAG TPA: molybdenum cofactor biosynthesis protein MoaE [Polyangiaceae bacterium]|jgi:molybdopterin synthase catalytic subunit|nr:molybdenum cofactor biosynthesis protein MoaE [Polyangiaceae bacterium]
MNGRVQVRESPLSVDECVNAVARPSAGGTAVFIGTVRDESDGRRVTLLEYQAYASMAEKEMERIALAIEAELPGVTLAALHRVGALAVGDVAVVCAASAAHRHEAFVATRRFIDRIKEQVPIWKREHGPDGPHWVGWQDARCAPHGDHDGSDREH